MNILTVFQSFKKNIDSLIAAVVGLILIDLYTKHSGIGISPDSIVYASVTRNLLNGIGIFDYSGRPMVDFPAFYPIFLSIISWITKQDVIHFAPVLNGLLFATVIYTSGYIMEQFITRSKWYKWIVLLCITFSPALIEVYFMLWSETLFILFSLLFFIALKYYLKSHSLFALIIISSIAALAFVTRYAGITFVAVGVVLILVDRDIDWIKKMIHFLLFGTIGISLTLINFIRNLLSAGMLAGIRQSGITPLNKNTEYYGLVLYNWLGFQTNNHFIDTGIGIAILTIFIVIGIWLTLQYSNFSSFENISIIFFIVYVSFIVLSSTLSRYETINSRLMAPAFIPFIWGITFYIPRWLKNTENNLLKWIKITSSFVIAFLFIRAQYLINNENYSYMKDSGIPGYTEDDWTQSTIVKFIQKDSSLFKSGRKIYSNQNHAVYFYTGHQTITVPESVHQMEVNGFYENKNCYLIWFKNDLNTDLLSLTEISKKKKLIPLQIFPDGAIYLCSNDSVSISHFQ